MRPPAQAVHGRLFISLERGYVQSSELRQLAHPDCCGVVLFSENYQNIEQLRDLCQAIRASRREDLLIGIDREGGRLQRLGEPFTPLPAAIKLGRAYRLDQSRALAIAADLGWLRAAELRSVGVDFSFAPVLDLHYRGDGVIGERALSREPSVVSALGQALAAGARRAGAISVAKHFPGHGHITTDSHTEECIDERGYNELIDNDLHPFATAAAAHVEAIMSAHIRFPRIDADTVTYSRFWVEEVLRGRLGFRGLLMSDDLCMAGAAREGERGNLEDRVAGRAQAALAAGHDLALVCKNFDAAAATLAALASGRGRSQPFARALTSQPAPLTSWEKLQSNAEFLRVRGQLESFAEEYLVRRR